MSPKYNLMVYPGAGSADGIRGNHIILAPPFANKKDLDHLVNVITAVIIEVFNNILNKA